GRDGRPPELPAHRARRGRAAVRPEVLLGALVLVALVAALGVGARSVRRRLPPEWRGPPAVLADVLLALGASTVVLQVLGAVGGFRIVPVTVALAALGAGAWWWGRVDVPSTAPASTAPATAAADGPGVDGPEVDGASSRRSRSEAG